MLEHKYFFRQQVTASAVFSTLLHKHSLLAAVAARGEIGREGCEISSLVEHMGLSPWLMAVFIISGVSSQSSSPNLIKLVIFSCPY